MRKWGGGGGGGGMAKGGGAEGECKKGKSRE